MTSTAPVDVVACLRAYAVGDPVDRELERAAVKAVIGELTSAAPGSSVELRVPPYAAAQLVGGTRHRRGTPPAVVQMSPPTLLRLAVGALGWEPAVADGSVRASGERSDLSGLLPIYPPVDA